MTDRPIIFSAPMVRALLDGRKTQTRRIVKDVPPQPAPNCHPSHTPRHPAPYLDSYCGQPKTAANPRGMSTEWMWWQVDDRCGYPSFKVKFAPGDRLWVRETWAHYQTVNHTRRSHGGAFSEVSDGLAGYRADGHDTIEDFREHVRLMSGCDLEAVEINGNKWRPSIFMPRWASRLTLTVTDVRVQWLQEITLGDICAEGLARSIYDFKPVQRGFDAWVELWEHINGAGSWAANPWVAVYTFTVERRNIDEVGK